MNRWEYWLRADTQYRVHSPFVFDLYRKVLFARLDRTTRKRVCAPARDWRDRRFHELVYKLADHYGLTLLDNDGDIALLEGSVPVARVAVVRRPHRDARAEQLWRDLQADPTYRVSIDMYDAGVLLDNPKLHPQHFLLK